METNIASPLRNESGASDGSQITHVLNKDKKYLSEHGQKLFNAINCLLDEQEQLELTQALFKYQKEHNVFTLVRTCCELFDTSRKKSLMLFMRPVIPVRDRFHYDEYYKLFFPEEFTTGVRSIFTDLIPKDLLEKTLKKANEKKKINQEKEKEQEQAERLAAIQILEKANYDLNLDLQKLMCKASITDLENENNEKANANTNNKPESIEQNSIKIAGFRIIDLAPQENESLGFDICMGPTGTFIMISFVENGSVVEKLGMKAGDELVSVNEISFKMIELEQAIEILSTEPSLRIVLQTSGFLPEQVSNDYDAPFLNDLPFSNEWTDPLGNKTSPPSENKTNIKRFIRKLILKPKSSDNGLGFKIRGGIEYSLGVFISQVESGTNADLIGLKVSDQIIECNGQSFSRISNPDAEYILKTALINYKSNKLPIKITVRYLGKLPILKIANNNNKTSIDKNITIENNNNLTKNVTVNENDSLKVLFDSVLDFRLFIYFINEYDNNRLTVQYLVYLILKNFKNNTKLFKNDPLSSIIKQTDLSIYKNIMEFKKNSNKDIQTKEDDKERILTNEFKNSILVRSSEVLNDLNINTVKKCSKYLSEHCLGIDKIAQKKICKSLDCLDII